LQKRAALLSTEKEQVAAPEFMVPESKVLIVLAEFLAGMRGSTTILVGSRRNSEQRSNNMRTCQITMRARRETQGQRSKRGASS
jgi:hypothetical protein